MTEQLCSSFTAHNVREDVRCASLEDEVVDVSQRGSDAFQQQVERLNSCGFLSRVLAAGAQRQTEVELKYKIECVKI